MVTDEGETAGLKFNIKKAKIVASGPITSWQIEGENVKAVTQLFSWASKSSQTVAAATISRHVLLGRRAMTNLDSLLKSRDIILPTKVHLVKALLFPVVM